MSKKRLFIAIGLPDDIKEDLAREVEKLQPALDPGVRFAVVDSWHITLVFLGDQSDDDINLINQALAETVTEFAPAAIRFDRIAYGPIGRTPRMIWLVADRATSKHLAAIKADLEKRLFERVITFEQEHRQFEAHLTLARFNSVSRSVLPALAVPFPTEYTAGALDLMESHLARAGAEYGVLASFDFEGEE